MNQAVVRLLERPHVYLVWQSPFVASKLAPIWRDTNRLAIRRVLAAGCGPGTNAREFTGLDYLSVDINPSNIAHARARHELDLAVAGVRTDTIPGKSTYDFALVNSLLHHLDDEATDSLLQGLCKYIGHDSNIHVIELELPENRGMPRFFQLADRGEHPRNLDRWRDLLTRHYAGVGFERFPIPECRQILGSMVYFKGSESPASAPRVSVAIALHDAEAVFPELVRRVSAVLKAVPGGPREMVFVDDGSSDQTFDPIVESASVDPRIVGARLSRNFGHHAALETLTEDIVVVMAGDLQDRPEEIPDFMAEHAGGYDVVYAQRVRRRGSLLSCTAFFFYRPMKRMSGVDVPVDSGDFALLPRRVVDQVNRLPKRHRYLRGLPAWVGSPQTEIVVERDPRAGGDASYTLRRLVRLALDGVFALSVTPLRAAWLLGACVSAAASFYAVWVIFERLFIGGAPRGFTALIVAITFVAGVQLLFLGLISEYFGRVVDEAKGRPHVVVTDVARGDRRKAAGRRDAPILTGLAS